MIERMVSLAHELRETFPQQAPLIERLVRSNYRFRRLVERYDEINRNIHCVESENNPMTEQILARLNKRRLKIKKDIAVVLVQVANRTKDFNQKRERGQRGFPPKPD